MQRRPVTIRGAAHDERFARRGVLQIGIPHPRPDWIQVAAVAQSSLVDEMKRSGERRSERRKRRTRRQGKRVRERRVALTALLAPMGRRWRKRRAVDREADRPA
jgi:hypothetical protein